MSVLPVSLHCLEQRIKLLLVVLLFEAYIIFILPYFTDIYAVLNLCNSIIQWLWFSFFVFPGLFCGGCISKTRLTRSSTMNFTFQQYFSTVHQLCGDSWSLWSSPVLWCNAFVYAPYLPQAPPDHVIPSLEDIYIYSPLGTAFKVQGGDSTAKNPSIVTM